VLPCYAHLNTDHFFLLPFDFFLPGKNTLITEQDLHQSASANFVTKKDLRQSMTVGAIISPARTDTDSIISLALNSLSQYVPTTNSGHKYRPRR